MDEILTSLPSNTREMILVIPEVLTLKGNQCNDSGLLGFVGYFVCIEGLGGEFGGLFSCCAFALCWRVVARGGFGGDGFHLRLGYGCCVVDSVQGG